MCTNIRLVVLGVTILASTARADQWVSPTHEKLTSPNKRLEAVIKPATDAKTGATATIGEKGQPGKTFTLATPWMPVDSVLFDDGSLLTLDNWHQLGHGTVATVYERDGKIRWKRTLAELVGQPFVDSASHSVSSIWWRKKPLEWSLAKDGNSGLITLFDENQLQIELRDGRTKMVAVVDLPDDPQRLLNRARSIAPTDGPGAIALLDRALARDPDLFEAILLYVDVLQRANEDARAVTALERMSTRWKTKDGYNIANVYVAWAKSLTTMTRKADAERRLRLAVAAAPTYANPVITLATLLVDQGKTKETDAVLDEFVNRLLKASYLDTHGLANVADFYKNRKQHAKALAHYLKAYKKDQVTNQFLYASLAQLYEEMGRDLDAIRIYEQLLAYFTKMGSSFDSYIKETRDALARLRAKKRP